MEKDAPSDADGKRDIIDISQEKMAVLIGLPHKNVHDLKDDAERKACKKDKKSSIFHLFSELKKQEQDKHHIHCELDRQERVHEYINGQFTILILSSLILSSIGFIENLVEPVQSPP
jgi:hypothetical protein